MGLAGRGSGAVLVWGVRPLSVLLGLAGTRTTWRIRGLVGWFGVRGISVKPLLAHFWKNRKPMPGP